jgi:hypothetical protein
VNGLQVWLPHLEIVLSVCENLSRICAVRKWVADIARNDRRVVKQVQESATMFGKDDLLLSTLYRSSEVEIICFLELLASLRLSV